MSAEKNMNRRQEQRMILPDLNLKVKKSGLSHHFYTYATCRSVDLSLNGFSFSNNTLELKVPEKVDFILTIENYEIKGHAVTCNVRETATGIQYGLMFLSVFPEISAVFSEQTLSTQTLESLAINQAESLVYDTLIEQKGKQERLALSKQQQLFDACRCYLIRLGEMGARMPTVQTDKSVHPVQAVKIFRGSEQVLLLRWHNPTSGQTEQLNIALDPGVLRASFVVNDNIRCKSVVDVLNVLGEQIKQQFNFI